MEDRIDMPWQEWKVFGLLGRGTFGNVYKVVKTEYGHISEAAVKIIRVVPDEQKKRELESSGISVESYLQEVQTSIVKEIEIMESLKGAAHIVAIEDSSIQKVSGGWVIYIRMELLKSLREMQKKRSFALEDIIRLGCDLCKALEVCEKKEIIHRDIKPANIFWSDLGGYKLGDFGIARHMEHTMAGTTKAGTESYMAPEIYRGENYGRTVDIYSLGLVLYQIANNGRLPFLPPTGVEIGYSAVTEADRRRRSGEAFPDPFIGGSPLGNVLRKACAFYAKDRYQSASELKRDLTRLMYMEEDISDGGSATQILPDDGNSDTLWYNDKIPPVPDNLKTKKKSRAPWIIFGVSTALASLLILGTAVFLNREKITDLFTEKERTVQEETASPNQENMEDSSPEDDRNLSEAMTAVTEQMPYSSRMWENGDMVYTVYDVEAEGFTSISGCYVDTMAVYGDKIYWRMNNGVENVPCPIIAMDIDGGNKEFLTEHSYASSFLAIDNGWLYYISVDENGTKESRKINLETREEEAAPPYFFRNGNETVWFSTGLEDGKWYVSKPGFQDMERIKDLKGSRLALRGSKIYYMVQEEDNTYTTYSYDAETGAEEILLTGQYAKSIVSRDGLYYKKEADGRTILTRIDLESGEQRDYDLGNFHLYMGGGFYELKDQICLMRFCPENEPENTEFWSMDRESGERRLIGQWYNSNAVNAAAEP